MTWQTTNAQGIGCDILKAADLNMRKNKSDLCETDHAKTFSNAQEQSKLAAKYCGC